MTIVPPEPGEIRDTAREILDRPAFDERRSILERVLEWIGDRLSDLFSLDVGAAGPGLLGRLIGFALIAGTVILLIRLLRGSVWRTRSGTGDDAAEVVIDAVPGRAAADWDRLADDHEAAGLIREALLARYRALVGRLVDAGVIDAVPGRTTGELRREVAQRNPAASSAFDTATDVFESVWYGGRPAAVDDATALRASATEAVVAVTGRRPVGAGRGG